MRYQRKYWMTQNPPKDFVKNRGYNILWKFWATPSVELLLVRFKSLTLWKTNSRVDVQCVKSVRMRSFLIRIQSECSKIRTRKLQIRTIFAQWLSQNSRKANGITSKKIKKSLIGLVNSHFLDSIGIIKFPTLFPR